MKRGFDSRRDQAIADETYSGQAKCTVCGKWAEQEEISSHGSRCRSCFRGYCNELNRDIGSVHTKEDKLEICAWLRGVMQAPADPKSWATRLRDKEQAGETITRLQARMWRAALGEQSQ